MLKPHLVIKSTAETTRLYMTLGEDELLRASLPTPVAPPLESLPTLCEGLSTWLARPLSIALCVDGPDASSALGLCDGFGFGRRTLYYEVEVLDRSRRRRGLGSFRDLRQLDLRGIR
jgi:hypothetical protein